MTKPLVNCNWTSILTFSGKYFDFADPDPKTVDIIDIAQGLSLICRFAGQCLDFYSVAEHSCHVHDVLPKEYKKWGLLHDRDEAYITDVVKPLKNLLPDYQRIERQVGKVTAQALCLEGEQPHIVGMADLHAIICEQEYLMPPNNYEWVTPQLKEDLSKLFSPIKPKYWSPTIAKNEFLTRYYKCLLEEIPVHKDNVVAVEV
jgi:hypothetical protein